MNIFNSRHKVSSCDEIYFIYEEYIQNNDNKYYES